MSQGEGNLPKTNNDNSPNKGKIDMNHGFMKSIIRNQHDRDNYDKEVQSRSSSSNGIKNHARSKKPDVAVYQPPRNRRVYFPGADVGKINGVSHHEQRKNVIFKVEFQDENGCDHVFNVHEDEDLKSLSCTFGTKVGLSPDLIEALHIRLKDEYSAFKMWHFYKTTSDKFLNQKFALDDDDRVCYARLVAFRRIFTPLNCSHRNENMHPIFLTVSRLRRQWLF